MPLNNGHLYNFSELIFVDYIGRANIENPAFHQGIIAVRNNPTNDPKMFPYTSESFLSKGGIAINSQIPFEEETFLPAINEILFNETTSKWENYVDISPFYSNNFGIGLKNTYVDLRFRYQIPLILAPIRSNLNLTIEIATIQSLLFADSFYPFKIRISEYKDVNGQITRPFDNWIFVDNGEALDFQEVGILDLHIRDNLYLGWNQSSISIEIRGLESFYFDVKPHIYLNKINFQI
jgi:hypothetical protein